MQVTKQNERLQASARNPFDSVTRTQLLQVSACLNACPYVFRFNYTPTYVHMHALLGLHVQLLQGLHGRLGTTDAEDESEEEGPTAESDRQGGEGTSRPRRRVVFTMGPSPLRHEDDDDEGEGGGGRGGD